MSAPRAAQSSGDPPLPYCERCGKQVDQTTIGPLVGLCHCPSCNGYVCRWCWADAAGACPACGIVPFADAAAAGVAGVSGPALPQGRRDLRAPIAVGAIFLVVSALAVIVGSPFRPARAVEGAVATSAAVTSASPSPGLSPLPSPSGGLTSATAGASTAASPLPTAATPSPIGTPVLPPRSATPTPPPRPTVTPTPTPTPMCKTVPDLVGRTVSNARAVWTAFGFTGSFSPAAGLNKKTVRTQSEAAGGCRPSTTTIVVTYA